MCFVTLTNEDLLFFSNIKGFRTEELYGNVTTSPLELVPLWLRLVPKVVSRYMQNCASKKPLTFTIRVNNE